MADKPSVPRSTAIAIGIASILLITSLLLLQRLGVSSDLNLRQADELTELRRQVDGTLQTDKGDDKLRVACVLQAPLDQSIEDLDSAYRQLLRQLNAEHHLYLTSDSLNSADEDAVQSGANQDCLSSEQVIARIARIRAQLRDTKNTPPKRRQNSHSIYEKSPG